MLRSMSGWLEASSGATGCVQLGLLANALASSPTSMLALIPPTRRSTRRCKRTPRGIRKLRAFTGRNKHLARCSYGFSVFPINPGPDEYSTEFSPVLVPLVKNRGKYSAKFSHDLTITAPAFIPWLDQCPARIFGLFSPSKGII
jgi:hypothetical protein